MKRNKDNDNYYNEENTSRKRSIDDVEIIEIEPISIYDM